MVKLTVFGRVNEIGGRRSSALQFHLHSYHSSLLWTDTYLLMKYLAKPSSVLCKAL